MVQAWISVQLKKSHHLLIVYTPCVGASLSTTESSNTTYLLHECLLHTCTCMLQKPK